MKRILTMLLILALCISLSSCQKKKELKDDIHIFFTSDIHCGVNEGITLAGVKALVEDAKAEHEYVTLVDCGDNIQGGPLGSLSKGELIIPLMNETGYDIATFGNHEFDYGMEQLGKLISMMEYQPILCNYKYSGTKKNVFDGIDPYIIKEYGDYKVAFIGLLTPATITTSTPTFFMEDGQLVYDFYGGDKGEALAARVQEVVDEVRGKGADYVVVISHLGVNEPSYDTVSFIHMTKGVDVFLDGHAHANIVEDKYPDADNNDVIVSSPGTKLETVGELIIDKDGSIQTLHIDAYDRKDETLQAKVDKALGDLDVILSEKISEIDHDLKVADENGHRLTRTRETTAADFVVDAIREEMGTQIAILNGGSVRTALEAGDITKGDLLAILPFENLLSSVKMSGQTILDALEYGSSQTEAITVFDDKPVGEAGSFLQVSGLKYTIDTSVPSPIKVDSDQMFASIEGERRVKNVYVLEEGEYVPIDPEKIYTVSSNNYILMNKGDGYTMFEDCEVLVKNGPVDVSSLINYAKNHNLNDMYLDVEGRITVK